jgi:hypothetical protein
VDRVILKSLCGLKASSECKVSHSAFVLRLAGTVGLPAATISPKRSHIRCRDGLFLWVAAISKGALNLLPALSWGFVGGFSVDLDHGFSVGGGRQPGRDAPLPSFRLRWNFESRGQVERCAVSSRFHPNNRLTGSEPLRPDYFRFADHPGVGRSLTDQVELLRTGEVLFLSTENQYLD